MEAEKKQAMAFELSAYDEKLLQCVADTLHRSKANTLRWLIYRAAQETGVAVPTPTFTQINLINEV